MNELPALALAYIGDAVYELKIRDWLLEQGIVKVKELQEKAVQYVSAKAQARYAQSFLKLVYTEEERQVFLRARNHKSHKSPKNTDIITYKMATGFEAVIGYLHWNHQDDRITELIEYIKKYAH